MWFLLLDNKLVSFSAVLAVPELILVCQDRSWWGSGVSVAGLGSKEDSEVPVTRALSCLLSQVVQAALQARQEGEGAR